MTKLGVAPESVQAKQQRKSTVRDAFSFLYLIAQVIMIVLYAICTEFPVLPSSEMLVGTENRVDNLYTFYVHISLLLFAGIGLLYSYLKKFGLSGIGYTLMISAFAIQYSILVKGLFDEAGKDSNDEPAWNRIVLGFDDLIWGLYGATTALVALGATVGRSSPIQQFLITLFIIPFFGLNYFIGHYHLDAVDLGGSMYIFLFGSIFGLTFVLISTRPEDRFRDNEDNESRYDSDIFALLGTVIIWVLWPSFNAAFAPDTTQYRVVINTILALTTSVVFAFLFSRIFRGGRFFVSDVQRASIAGGIGMASCASFLVSPGGAMIIGAVSGILSIVGLVFMQPLFRRKLKLHDSIGVFSTYTLPSLVGALSGVFSSAIVGDGEVYGQGVDFYFPEHGTSQGGYNFGVMVISILIGALGAIPLALGFRHFGDTKSQLYSDEVHWQVPSDFELREVDDDEEEENEA